MNLYLVLFGVVFITAGIMESVRRKVTKLKVKELTCKMMMWAIGLSLSLVLVAIAILAFRNVMGDFNVWKVLFYALVVYFIQKDITMEVLKPILNKIKERI